MEFRLGEVRPDDVELFNSLIREIEKRKSDLGPRVRPAVCMSPTLLDWMQQACPTKFDTTVYTFSALPVWKLLVVPESTARRWLKDKITGGASPAPTDPIIPDREG